MKNILFVTLLVLLGATVLASQTYAQNIQAFNAEDIDYGTWIPGNGNRQSNDFFCVYKDAGNARWNVVANGSGPGGAFELSDGMGNTLPIDRVRIRNRNLTAGVSQNNIGNADTTPPADCGGTDNQRLRVRLISGDLDAATPGIYTGTLTFTVTPN